MTDHFSSKPTDATDLDDGDDDPTAGDMMPISRVLDSLQADFPDVSVSKIRFLETRGLVTPHRAPSGYRRFSSDDVDRLRWILTMQRDYFLPLRVIKERLESGAGAPESGPVEGGSDAGSIAPPTMAARTPSSRFRAPGPDNERLEPADLARLAGLTPAQLDDLARFGLVEAVETEDGPRYGREELRVAQAAGTFLQRGIEARHLKAWRVAAEREAGMLEQIITPLRHQNTPDATTRAREVADDLIDMGNTIREAIIVKELRKSLGTTAD